LRSGTGRRLSPPLPDGFHQAAGNDCLNRCQPRTRTRAHAPKSRSGFRRMLHQIARAVGSVVDIVVQGAVEAEYLAFLRRIGSRSLERDRMHAALDFLDITQILHQE